MKRLALSALLSLAAVPAFGQAGAPAPAKDPPAQPVPAKVAMPAQPHGTLAACRVVLLPPGTRETIQANVNVGTRIQFPGEVKTFQVDTPGLWDGSAKDDSLFIRPKTTDPDAAATGVSVFLANGRKFDFVVERTDALPNRCVLVADFPPSPAAAHATDSKPRRPARLSSRATAQLLARQQEQFDQQLAEMRRQIESQARDRIKAFQYAINTRYAWAGNPNSPDERELISAVYDDGRFTYVRIATSAFGLPSLAASLNDKDVLVHYTYDDLTGVFTVQGLYDRLRVRLGSHQIDITRQG